MLLTKLHTTTLGLAAVMALGGATAAMADQKTAEPAVVIQASDKAGGGVVPALVPAAMVENMVTVTGTVLNAKEDGFEMSYGESGSIAVALENWNWYDASHAIKTGEKVTVYGNIDKNFYKDRAIKASSIYAHNRRSYYFSNVVDEQAYQATYNYYTPSNVALDDVPDNTWLSVKGKVSAVGEDGFTLSLGSDSISVETDDMAYNPMDNEGHQRIEMGDHVYVYGEMDKDFFEDREIEADHIVTFKKSHKR